MDGEAVPELDLFEQPIPDAPDPADRAGAAAHYVECEYGISNGGWSMDFGPTSRTSDAEGALSAFLDHGLFNVPREGYAFAGRDADRVLYTYLVAGSPKVAVIVERASDGWVVETFATCDPAEYDPSVDDQTGVDVWLDADGNRVPTSIVTTFTGPGHCDWESVTFLIYEDRQYISDPRGVLDALLAAPFDEDTELPSDAVDTGYRHDGRELWLSEDGTMAYLAAGDRVEAWPTPDLDYMIGCA